MRFAICCDPPRAKGQPCACAMICSTNPNAALGTCSSGRTECAAKPAKSARARAPRKKCSAAFDAERNTVHPKRSGRQRMSWKTEWPLHAGFELGPSGKQRGQEPHVALAILAEIFRRRFHGPLEDYCRAVIERMRQRRRGLNPFQPALLERQAAEKRRPHRHGVNTRTDVVQEARERQFRRSRPAAQRFFSLDQQNGAARLGDRNRGGEPVRPAAHDDRVIFSARKSGGRGHGFRVGRPRASMISDGISGWHVRPANPTARTCSDEPGVMAMKYRAGSEVGLSGEGNFAF